MDSSDTISVTQRPARHPFTFNSPGSSSTGLPSSASYVSGTSSQRGKPTEKPFFRSRRIKKGEVERPWLERKDPKAKWVWIIPLIGLIAGIGLTGFLVWNAMRKVTSHTYCSVLDENFSSGTLDMSVWTKEVEVGGFGNGQFEETTGDDTNAYIKDGQLWIVPSLQDTALVESDSIINLLSDGTCTGSSWTDCVAVTNTTNGTIVNPVKSARLNTKKGASIKFGRVEVEAKLPSGDWLWPAIWMLPTVDTYGAWPASGEIDIAESRGNNYTYKEGGNEIVSSTLHYGPDSDSDAWWRNIFARKALHTTYADGFHVFGLEWSEKYMYTFIDNRLTQVMYIYYGGESFWKRGDFGVANSTGFIYDDTWAATGSDATPFDEDFYLILDVAVGGTNGWFKDDVASKPWVDDSHNAKADFWQARKQWYPTWEKGGHMIVNSVKMWQQAGYNGCK